MDQYAAKFGLIYLDYCGVPCGSKGFSPVSDVFAAGLLIASGYLAMTFSKRSKTWRPDLDKLTSCAEKQKFVHLGDVNYFETSAMVYVLFSKGVKKSAFTQAKAIYEMISHATEDSSPESDDD